MPSGEGSSNLHIALPPLYLFNTLSMISTLLHQLAHTTYNQSNILGFEEGSKSRTVLSFASSSCAQRLQAQALPSQATATSNSVLIPPPFQNGRNEHFAKVVTELTEDFYNSQYSDSITTKRPGSYSTYQHLSIWSYTLIYFS